MDRLRRIFFCFAENGIGQSVIAEMLQQDCLVWLTKTIDRRIDQEIFKEGAIVEIVSWRQDCFSPGK